MRRRDVALVVPILMAAFGYGLHLYAGTRTDSTAAETAAPTASNGQVLIAAAGYHFTIPPDFNGGIFGVEILNRVTFNAKKDADGSVNGWFTYEQEVEGSVFSFGGPVTCLNIYDTPVLERTPEVPPQTHNRAKWGGRVEKSNDASIPVGTFMWFQSIDNGEGSNGWSDASTLPGVGTEAANEAFCNIDRVPNPNFGPHRVGGGNIQVR